MSQTTVLVLGASGYLGQFVSQQLAKRNDFKVVTTHLSHPLPNSIKLDFTDANQVRDFVIATKPDVIINTVAISNIKQNDSNPDLASKINIPSAIVESLISDQTLSSTKFIHFSTDQGNKLATFS